MMEVRGLFLLVGLFLANVSLISGDIVSDDNPCGNTTFTNATGTTGMINGQDPGKGKNCTYYIVAGSYVPQVAIRFNKLNLNPLVFNLTVYGVSTTDGGNSTSRLIANLTDVAQELPYVMVVSRYNVTQIVFSHANTDTPSQGSSFSASYDTAKCMFEEQSLGGVIQSPIYVPGNGTVNCVYTEKLLQPMGVLSFLNFNVSSGYVLVQFGSGTATNVTGPVPDLFGTADATSLTVNVTLNNSTDPQNFTALFQTVDPRCSGVFQVDATFKQLSIPDSNQLPVICYAQLNVAGEGRVYIENGINYTQTAGYDSIVYYDGANTRAPVIGTLNDQMQWFVSSKKSMTVVASLGAQSSRSSKLQYRSDSYNNFYTMTNKSPSVKTDLDGTTVNNSTVKLLFVSKDPSQGMVKIELNNNNSITDAVITVKCELNTFTFTKDSAIFPVVMPSARASVVISKLAGNQRVSLTATAVAKSECYQMFSGSAGQIVFDGSKTAEKMCNLLVTTVGDVILEMKQVNLCQSGTLVIFQGFNKGALVVASFTANSTYPTIPQIRFPAGSPPSLVWQDNNNTCKGPTVIARYWTQDNDATCGQLSTAFSGSVQTPNYPNQYPLNVKCNWTLPEVNNSMTYLSVNTMDFQPGQNITLQNKSGIIANFSGSTLPGDLILPNSNFSLIFNSGFQGQGQQLEGGLAQSGQGAKITYKVLTCGGLVTKYPANLTVPSTKNQSVECIWIIQVPLNGTKKSVNVVTANVTVAGYKNATNGVLEIHNGNSVRDPVVVVNMTQKNATQIYSRTNFLFVRYVYTTSTSSPFSLNFTYSTYNCNSSSQCDNGLCILPGWRCNGIPNCKDGADERNCNGSQPIPPTPTPAPSKGGKKAGVAGYWVFICLVIGIVLGVVLMVMVPKCIRRFRGRNRTPGSNYGSLHEET